MSDEVQRTLGRMEGKLDDALKQLQSHEPRISSLEKWQAWTFGAAAGVGVLVAALWQVITHVR